ncbi:MAG: serine hydrolase [Desulfobacterales bacterium]
MKTSVKVTMVLVSVFFVVLIAAYTYFSPIFEVGTGYAAKILCSSAYVSGREYKDIINQDLDMPGISRFNTRLVKEERAAEASFLGIFKSRAIFRPGLGCTLCVDGVSEIELRQEAMGIREPDPTQSDEIWPEGKAVSDHMSLSKKLASALDMAFDENSEALRRTRAVVIVYNGRIVAERYAPGITKDTPLLGWSMTKSVTNALVGILVKENKLDLAQTDLMPQWRKEGDPRSNITLDQLLRMSSGLAFLEAYEEPITSDVNKMLFTASSASDFAAEKPLEAEPGSKWYYSSGTTNIIARIARDAAQMSQTEWFRFPKEALFDKIGMKSAVLEPDPSGNFVGSSYMYATARDWARFGLLYLNDGVWSGERILPEGWVAYSTTPTPHTEPGQAYGAQFWLNHPNPQRRISFLPDDAFMALGHECQAVVIIPSRNAVVVRLGLYRGPDFEAPLDFIENVLQILPPVEDHPKPETI